MATTTLTSKHTVTIPNADKTVSVEVELIPADKFAKSLAKNTNVAKVKVGGKDFYAVMGKTV